MNAMPASAATVHVVVNGQQMQFDQPPVEQNGRVFVPLRGVFEKLGASVAYEHGFINAIGSDGKSISLSVGSHNALVDGRSTTLDVAPFMRNGRTLVPLRFVSSALGASVDYAPGSQIVTISSKNPSGQAAATATKSNTSWILPAAAAALVLLAGSSHHSTAVSLNNVSPASGSVAPSTRPTISGAFSAAVDPNSIAVTLDGNNQSQAAYASPTGFSFTPTYDLGPGSHTVRVTGRSQSGATFDQSWSFSTTSYSYGPYSPNGPNGGYGQNYVSSVYPRDGSTVSGSFAITGSTTPNARVTIAVIRGGGGLFGLGAKTDNYETTADGRGQFYQNVYIASGSGDVRVQITSNAPYSNASSATLTYHT